MGNQTSKRKERRSDSVLDSEGNDDWDLKGGWDGTWDDLEESNYRDWLRAQRKNDEKANFTEYQKEVEYRQAIKKEQERRGSDRVEWEDVRELLHIQKYHREDRERWSQASKGRRNACQPVHRVDWDDRAEGEARENARKLEKRRKNQPLVWDTDKFGFAI